MVPAGKVNPTAEGMAGPVPAKLPLWGTLKTPRSLTAALLCHHGLTEDSRGWGCFYRCHFPKGTPRAALPAGPGSDHRPKDKAGVSVWVGGSCTERGAGSGGSLGQTRPWSSVSSLTGQVSMSDKMKHTPEKDLYSEM